MEAPYDASGLDDESFEAVTAIGLIEYLADDELLEITPKSLRLRKRVLDPNMRKKEAKAAVG